MGLQELNSRIRNCRKCDVLGLGCPKSPSIWYGTSFDGTLLVGESSPKDWVKTGSPFYNQKGMLWPSAKRLEEYLVLMGLDFEKVALVEAVKCVVQSGSVVKKAAKNCQPFLAEQLILINPKRIISFGTTALDSIENIYGIKCDVGQHIQIGEISYLPLYHPSPINPNSDKRNREYIEAIKSEKQKPAQGSVPASVRVGPAGAVGSD